MHKINKYKTLDELLEIIPEEKRKDIITRTLIEMCEKQEKERKIMENFDHDKFVQDINAIYSETTNKDILRYKLIKYYVENKIDISSFVDYFRDFDFKRNKELLYVSTISFAILDMKDRNKYRINKLFSEEEYNKYNDSLSKSYNNILDRTVDLAKCLDCDSSLKLSFLYTYLLWHGYYSKNHINEYKTKDRLNINNFYSLDIFNGYGVCLNYADLLTDILNKSDYKSSLLICQPIKISVDKKSSIKKIDRKISPSSIPLLVLFNYFTKPICDVFGNHAVTLTEDNGKLYVFDPTNILCFHLNNKYESEPILATGKMRLNPYFSLVLQKGVKLNGLDLLFTQEKEFEKIFDATEYDKLFNDCLAYFDQNKDLLDDFYNDCKSDIDNISEIAPKLSKCIRKF